MPQGRPPGETWPLSVLHVGLTSSGAKTLATSKRGWTHGSGVTAARGCTIKPLSARHGQYLRDAQ